MKFCTLLKYCISASYLLSFFVSEGAFAAPLEDVSLQQKGNDIQATITFTTPIHLLRYVPSEKSRVIEIYYERVASSDPTEPWIDQEVRNSPETSLTPAFTVTTRDQATQPRLEVTFSRDVKFTVSAGSDNRSIVITLLHEKTVLPEINNMHLPLLPIVALPPALQTQSVAGSAEAIQADTNQQAYRLMQAGRDALSDKDYSTAIQIFNSLLLLPPNAYSQDAQEWVGVARERGGQNSKAKAEYELYLKLYTTGEGVQRVRQRLARLGSTDATNHAEDPARKAEGRSFVQGGISSRYYLSQSNFQSTYQYFNAPVTDSYSIRDQSSLITNVDATGRFVNDKYDNRIVFRDVEVQNNLPGQINSNQVYAAYLETKNKISDYSARLGRQTGGAGVMGRFDGVLAGYGSPQDLRVNAVAGQLVDFTTNIQPVFYGASVDRGPVSIYFIDQTIQSITDRRAMGSEFRYFEGKKTAYALADYDIYFNALNTLTFTGSYGLESGMVFNFMADYRKNLSMLNALNGATTNSIDNLLTVMSEEQLKQLALDRSVTSTYTQFGITQKLNATWQAGGDIRLAKTSGMPASGSLIDSATGLVCYVISPTCVNPTLAGYVNATPQTGLEKTVSAQLMATNLFTAADLTTFGTSYVTSDYIQNGQTLFLYNHAVLSREYSLDASWNYYHQNDNLGGSLSRHMPTLHGAYQMRQNLSLDADLGFELSTTAGPTLTSTNRRVFSSCGFRWNF